MATDPMLAGESRFSVMGLSLEELGAEKVLGWASKDQARHYIDLAYIARDHQELLNAEEAATLICEKFARERHSGRYRRIRNVGELASTFSAPARVKLIRDSWEEDLGSQILFLPEEQDRVEGSLADFANVERYVNEVWVPILNEASRRHHRR
jgi:Nucleotidyl transferase AbiEii toxin, Type IV TA system